MKHRNALRALSAGGLTVLFAVALVLLWFVLDALPLPLPEQNLFSLAIWTPLLGVYVTLCALIFAPLLERGMRFRKALWLGGAGGVLWVVLTAVRTGLWIAWLDVPVFVIWPVAAAVAMAAVTPRPGQGVESETRPWGAVVVGLLGLAAFIWIVKVEPPAFVNPDARWYALGGVAGERPSLRPARVEPAMPELGSGGAPLRAWCHDRAPRPLPLDPVVVDSSSRARVVGTFTDRREVEVSGARQVYGRTLRLWSVEGSLTGTLELKAGPVGDAGNRAVLEFVRYDDGTGSLRFDAYFADGFFSRFRGTLSEGAVEGVLETTDAECAGRILVTDTIVLTRDDGTVTPGGAPTFRSLASQLVASGAYRRERPEVTRVFGHHRLPVNGDRWLGATTSAGYFSGRFPGPRDAAAALDPRQVVTANGRSGALRDLLYAVRIGGSGEAEWVVVGPVDLVRAYEEQVHARARNGTPAALRHQMLQPFPCC